MHVLEVLCCERGGPSNPPLAGCRGAAASEGTFATRAAVRYRRRTERSRHRRTERPDDVRVHIRRRYPYLVGVARDRVAYGQRARSGVRVRDGTQGRGPSIPSTLRARPARISGGGRCRPLRRCPGMGSCSSSAARSRCAMRSGPGRRGTGVPLARSGCCSASWSTLRRRRCPPTRRRASLPMEAPSSRRADVFSARRQQAVAWRRGPARGHVPRQRPPP